MSKASRGNRSCKTRYSIVDKCRRGLKEKKVFTIDGIQLSKCKHNLIAAKFQEIYGYNPLLEFKRNKINNILEEKEFNSEYIYLITDLEEEYCKIGVSKDPQKRLSNLQTSNPKTLKIYSLFRGNKIIEGKLHKIYSELKIGGEWFSFKDSLYDKFSEYKTNHKKDTIIPEIKIDNNLITFIEPKFILSKTEYLYVLLNNNTGNCRIGISKNPESFENNNLSLIFKIEGNQSMKQKIYNKYEKYKFKNDWFKYDGKLKINIEKLSK